MKLRLIAFAVPQLLLSGTPIAAANCGNGGGATTTLSRSADITSLASSCATVSTSVFISAEEGDHISLDGIEIVEGTLEIAGCADARCVGAPLSSISSSTLRLVGGDVLFNDAVMETISFPALNQVTGSFSVRNTSTGLLELDAMWSVGNFSISLMNDLYFVALGIAQADVVSISGNGALVVKLGAVDAKNDSAVDKLVSRLDLSGIGELRWSELHDNMHVRELRIHDNDRLEELPLLFSGLSALEVRNNVHLTDVLFPSEDDGKSRLLSQLEQMLMTGNDRFNMTTIHDVLWNSTNWLSWAWPDENMDVVVLDGIIHNSFFQPLIDAHQMTTLENANSSRPRVLQLFNVTSSVSTFHCEPIDELRRHGAFPGDYSCNGNSIDMASDAFRTKVQMRVVGMLLSLAAAGLLFP